MTHEEGAVAVTSSHRPLRVAVIGAGPAGLFTADALTFEAPGDVEVDVLERLPVPFGLLRYGVAPDHPMIKSAADALQEVLERPDVHLFCNVEIGGRLGVDDVRRCYDAVVYATGADADRALGIKGEDLPGSESATSFVKWYNGHPEAGDFDLSSTRRAVVIGAGNVALDVTRILVKDPSSLKSTDVPEHELDALAASGVTDVHVVARRGVEHVKFSTKELRELGELPDVDIVLEPAAIPAEAPSECSPVAARNLALFRAWAGRGLTGAPRRIHFHFHARPEEVGGDDLTRSIRLLARQGAGTVLREIPAELVLRAVGYRSRPIVGVPFEDETATIPHAEHRVIRDGVPQVGEYAVGWAKRGPTGILGRNRADAEDTVRALLADRAHLLARRPEEPEGIAGLLRERGVAYIDVHEWNAIADNELRLGDRHGRPRVKIHEWDALLAARRPVVGVS